MKQFTLDLSTKSDDPRPIVYIENFFRIKAMLDTGAALPVLTHDEDFLKAIGGVKIREHFIFSGFGGNTQGTLYRIPTFTLDELTFPYLPIVATRMNAPFYMILSATMFS